MSDQDVYQRIMASLSDAMIDDTNWPATSALIDEASGITGNCLAVGEGPKSDRDGVLRARKAADRLRLERLVASALPASGAVAASGSMLLGRGSGSPPMVVHVKPVAVPQPDHGARHTAALILIVEPKSRHRIDPDLVAGILGLTPMESRVAVWLVEGKSVRDMAEATGRTEGSIYSYLKQIYQKQPVSRQADLVRLVLSITEFGSPQGCWNSQRAEVSPAALSYSSLPFWQGLGGAIALDRFPGSTGRTEPPAQIPVARSLQRARRRQGSRWPTGGAGHWPRLKPQRSQRLPIVIHGVMGARRGNGEHGLVLEWCA